jgi:hypothetical protein
VVVCKTGETLPQIALALSGAVPFGGLRLGGTIPLPVARMVSPPLARAVAAGLAIFRIADELPLAALAAAPLLARRKRAGGLLGVKSGWFELSLAKTAPQIHPYRVAALSRTPPPTIAAQPRLRNPNWEKITPQLPLQSVRLSLLAG